MIKMIMYVKRNAFTGMGWGGFIFLVLFASCSTQHQTHEGLLAVLWVQASAEYRACAEQAYRTAKEKLDLALKDRDWTAAPEQLKDYQSLPPAVVLDIDSTVLDNTLFEAFLVRENKLFSEELWRKWVLREDAAEVPGAREFVHYAQSKKVEIFYVTNRTADVEAATRGNLEKLGFSTKIEPDTVLTKGEKGWGSDKSSRRKHVSKDYRILLLVGDDFNDFVSGVEGKGVSLEDRTRLANQYRPHWGESWIMLPNPIYGSWEAALYDFDYGLPPSEKLKRQYEKLNVME